MTSVLPPPTPPLAAENSTPSSAETVLEAPLPSTSSWSESPQPLLKKKEVRFSDVCLHEHPIVLGNNTGGSHGVPVEIDWTAQDSFRLDVEKYENSRPERRSARELVLPASTRFELLRAAGYSRSEIMQQLKWARIERRRLRASVHRIRFQRLDEGLDALGRKFLNVVTLGIPKRRQREYLEECSCYAHLISAGQREQLKPCLKNPLKTSFDSSIRTASVTEGEE